MWFLACGNLVAIAQTPDSVVTGPDTTNVLPDTLEQKGFGFAFIPAIFYTPETGFAGGASVLLFFRGDGRGSQPSTVSPTLIFTAKSQIIAVVGYELNLRQDRYRVTGGLGFLKFPNDFYGIGSDTPDEPEAFTPESTFLGVSIQRALRPRFRLGLHYEFGHSEITEKESGGMLDSGAVPGSDGGTVSGLGPVFTWDSRDNLFYPKIGSFHTFAATFFNPDFGSDFVFERYNLNLRTYIPFLGKNVLALHAWLSFVTGNPPFQMMSAIGGSELMRGYYDGRYRDNHAAVFQAEWRRRLWWRFGATAFVGYGDVASRVNDFEIGDFKPAAGAGIRFVIDRGEGVAVRIDFGFIGGTLGPYITINEAF